MLSTEETRIRWASVWLLWLCNNKFRYIDSLHISKTMCRKLRYCSLLAAIQWCDCLSRLIKVLCSTVILNGSTWIQNTRSFHYFIDDRFTQMLHAIDFFLRGEGMTARFTLGQHKQEHKVYYTWKHKNRSNFLANLLPSRLWVWK